MHNITKIEGSLWEAADQLRANSNLTSSEYCMPVLGVIFLRHAATGFEAATRTGCAVSSAIADRWAAAGAGALAFCAGLSGGGAIWRIRHNTRPM